MTNNIGDQRFETKLRFHVQELGCVKLLAMDKPIYVPGARCEDALKDIIKYCKSEFSICKIRVIFMVFSANE